MSGETVTLQVNGADRPIFKSIMSAPSAATMDAASPITDGSDPKSCTASGFSAGWLFKSDRVLGLWRTIPSALTISDVTKSAPKLLAILRKLKSVIPAMGARIKP